VSNLVDIDSPAFKAAIQASGLVDIQGPELKAMVLDLLTSLLSEKPPESQVALMLQTHFEIRQPVEQADHILTEK